MKLCGGIFPILYKKSFIFRQLNDSMCFNNRRCDLVIRMNLINCNKNLFFASCIKKYNFFHRRIFYIFNSGKSWATAGKQVKSSNAKSNVIRFANAVPVPVSPYVLKEYLSPWMFKVGALRESP